MPRHLLSALRCGRPGAENQFERLFVRQQRGPLTQIFLLLDFTSLHRFDSWLAASFFFNWYRVLVLGFSAFFNLFVSSDIRFKMRWLSRYTISWISGEGYLCSNGLIERLHVRFQTDCTERMAGLVNRLQLCEKLVDK